MSNKYEMSDEELNAVSGGIDITNFYGNGQEYRLGETLSDYYTFTFPKSQKGTYDNIVNNLYNNTNGFKNMSQQQIDDMILAALQAPNSGVTLTPINPIKK